MACVNPDGTLTESAKNILSAVKEPKTPQEISELVGEPLYKVRAALRDLSSVFYVEEINNKFRITAEGLKKIS